MDARTEDSGMNDTWSPETWRGRPILQVPTYPDAEALTAVQRELRHFPPLVFAGEARRLHGRVRRLCCLRLRIE